jgi:hypothetical protein
MESRDVMDIYSGQKQELNYECTSCTRSYNVKFSVRTTDSRDCEYSLFCKNGVNLFGCIGLQRGENCILNRQYEPEEYQTLKTKIIAHMKDTDEYGEFFPIGNSPFAYNETTAFEFFPVNETFAKNQKWRWQPEDPKEHQTVDTTIPDHIDKVDDKVCNQLLACAQSGKNYRITPQELKFYRNHKIPIPTYCPDVRYQRRFELQAKPFSN